MLELRDYANEGGKLIVAGRNVHQAPTSTSTGLTATGPYTWTPDKLFGFYYPDNNGGDDDLPGTAFLRSRTTSNDTWQNYLGVVGRSGGIGTAVNATTPTLAGAPVTPSATGLFAGMAPIAVDSTAGNDPNQNADGTPLPLAKIPLRLRNWAARRQHQRAAAPERIEADYTTTPAQNATGGAIISTRDSVTFGFGLEQVDTTTRSELLKRSLSYLVPTTADTTAPTIVGFKYPAANSDGDARGPDRGRRDRVRRSWRPQAGQPVRRRRARRVASRCSRSSSATRRRSRRSAADGQAHRRGGRQGRQQVDPRPARQHRRHRRPGALAGAGQQADALRHADRRPDAVLRQRRVPQRPALVRVRVAAQRRPRSPAPRR